MPEQHDPLDWLAESRSRMEASRPEFAAQLAQTDEALIAVADEVAHAIVPVTRAFLEADMHVAQQAIANDAAIDERCRELEDTCYLLMARQAPVAGDLRRLVAVLRSVGDVQRSGDLLKHIAESLTWVHPPSMPEDLRRTIAELGSVSGAIFAAAVESWRRHDSLAAVELATSDDQVDLLQQYLLSELYTGGQSVEEAVSLALIARYYERIADHGVEIARHVAYFITGTRIIED